MNIEFRLLQLIVSHVSGDRLTIGLLHWDSFRLRAAMSFQSIPPWMASDREDLESSARAMIRAATGRRYNTGSSFLGLEHVVPVREGLGGALAWSIVHTARTGNAEAHFRGLAAELHLTEEAPHAAATYGRELRQELIEVGRELQRIAGERVRVSQPISKVFQVTPPVSWLNGRWHHALPMHLHQGHRRRMMRPAFEVVGQVTSAIPDEHQAVVIVDVPLEGQLAEAAHHEAETLRLALPPGRAEVLEVHGRQDMARRIRSKIEADVRVRSIG